MHTQVSSKPGTGGQFARGEGPARVLITGNQGYLGTVVAEGISAAGHEVTGLDTGEFATVVLGENPQDPPTICTDLREVTATDLSGFDAVVHLAALSDAGRAVTDEHAIGEVNHLVSVRLARAAKEAGVKKFLFASTCTAYEPGWDEPATESDRLCPTTPWAASKLRVEEEISALADSDFTPVSLRLANVYGFSPRLRSDLPVNSMVAEAVLGGRIIMAAHADTRQPMIHVRDAAEAVLRCLEAPAEAVHAASFNVGSTADTVSEAEVARMVVEAVPGVSLDLIPRSGRRCDDRRVDFGQIRRAVGFEAQHGIADGIAELLAAYTSAGVDAGDFLSTFSRTRRKRQPVMAGAIHARGRTGAHVVAEAVPT